MGYLAYQLVQDLSHQQYDSQIAGESNELQSLLKWEDLSDAWGGREVGDLSWEFCQEVLLVKLEP